MGPTTGTATIVFTDLAGSTELRSGLGEEAADELRREHDAALSEVVAAHRGRVVKGGGDGIMAAFESASDGVAAAVGMQQAVHELGRRHRLRLAIRVGVSAGDVSWENGDCFGLPVVEAARLEQAAEPGQILSADIVRVLARGRATVEFGPGRALALKGLAEPVSAYEIGWSPAERPRGTGTTPLFGRAAEVGLAVAAWERAEAGEGGTVLVAGEPGIGKTRLLEEIAARVTRFGGVVWWGAAYEGEARAYGPISEMVDGYLRVVDPRRAAEQLGAEAGLVARLAPAVRGIVEVVDPVALAPEAERERTVDAVVDFAAAVASTAPLLIVVDDAHWADASTVGLLRTLVRRASRLPVLVMIAYRDAELDRRHPLADALAGWRRQPSVVRIALRGLDRDTVGELVAAVAERDDVSAALVAAVRSETDGNPLFVREVILHLLEEGRFGHGQDDWSDRIDDLGIPEGVRDAIGRRLSRLTDDTNRLLAVASAFDAGFDLGDVAAVAGLDDDAAMDAVDEALAAQMVRPVDGFDRYDFVHALIRHTLWAELNPSRQVRLHRAIADQIEKRTGHSPSEDAAITLARHFHHSAALPGAERGVGYALVAADHAAARFAPAEELQAIAIALDLLPPGDEAAARLQERAARAAILAGQWAIAIDHARVAVGELYVSDGPTAACALAVALGRLAEQVETNAGWGFGHLADRHLALLDPASETAVQLLAWDVTEAEYHDPDNPGIPVDSPERRRMNSLASQLNPGQRPSGPAGYCYPSAAAMLADYRDADKELLWGFPFGGPGRYREASHALRSGIDELRAEGYPRLALILVGMLGRVRLVLGDLDGAAELEAEGEQLLPYAEPGSNATAQYDALSMFRAQLVELNLPEAIALVERLVFISSRPDFRWVRGPALILRASLLAASGDHQGALDGLAANLSVVERGFLGAANHPAAVHMASQTLWWTHSTDHVDVIERNLHSKVLQPDFSYAETDGRWSAALLCALTGRYDDARGWFQRAYERLTDQEAVLLLPHVYCDEVLMEIRRGTRRDRAHGRRCLDEARRWAERIGLPSFGPRIDDLQSRLLE